MCEQTTKPRQASTLIVDDQGPMLTVVGDLLGMMFPGAKLLRAADGGKALALFTAWQPGIALVDVRLPDADGIELVRQFKALAPQAILIVISMDNSAWTRDRAMAAGATAFIPKDRLFVELEPLLSNLELAGERA